MMASEIFEFDAAWAEKWTETRVPFLSAPTVHGLCRETQETFMVVVEKRDKPTLHRVILEHIEPGSVLITDEWKG